MESFLHNTFCPKTGVKFNLKKMMEAKGFQNVEVQELGDYIHPDTGFLMKNASQVKHTGHLFQQMSSLINKAESGLVDKKGQEREKLTKEIEDEKLKLKKLQSEKALKSRVEAYNAESLHQKICEEAYFLYIQGNSNNTLENYYLAEKKILKNLS